MTQAGLARGLSRLVASSLHAAWRGHAWELQGLHSWGCLEQPGRPHSRCETCRDVAPPSVGAPLPQGPRVTAGQSPGLHPLTPGCPSVTWVPGV